MKTKIIKKSGYYKLIIDDKEINKKYGYEDNPIVLGTISEFADAGQWSVEDYRLRKNSIPSPYLEDGVQEYKPKNQDEINYLEKNLHTFKIDNKTGILCNHTDGGIGWNNTTVKNNIAYKHNFFIQKPPKKYFVNPI